jgi:predicted cation transporter
VRAGETLRTAENETNSGVALRAGKIYIFVMALVFLGAGLKPLTEAVITKIADWQLFWINIISAALDNATLAAAEITPSMSGHKLTFILMGLLVAGGILIPGNIPNIICAGKLDIKSREWARVGVPAGLVLMGVYFTVLMLLAK